MTAYLAVLDWRRRVHALYAEVRRLRIEDPLAAHERWAAGRSELFATHSQSPLAVAQRASFTGLRYWPYDPSFACIGRVNTDVEPERYEVGMSGGEVMAFVRFGVVELSIGSLDVFWLDAYGGGLFLPFRDATAGESTYGGGRYLLDTAKGADLGSDPEGTLVCDFNFAYHPSCHYSPAWSCPLAPPANRLDVRVQAGELAFIG
jgi:uncharacterized protein (DUF1684 family)